MHVEVACDEIAESESSCTSGYVGLLVRPGTTDSSVLKSIFFEGEYDRIRLIKTEKRTPETIVTSILDGGANGGYSSIYFSLLFPTATIIAAEADPTNFNVLVRNTKRSFPNIIPVHEALFNVDGETVHVAGSVRGAVLQSGPT